MALIFMKPNPDRTVNGVPLRVRDLHTRQWVPAEGQYVEADDLYWNRIVLDGDLVPAEPPAE